MMKKNLGQNFGQTDRQTNRQTDKQTDNHTGSDVELCSLTKNIDGDTVGYIPHLCLEPPG